MTVGMPGTGLGGLFYIVLALLMPVRELYLTARGRSSRERWRIVAGQAAMALAIVTVLVVTTLAARHLVGAGSPSVGGTWLMAPALAAAVLVALALTIRVWAFAVARTAAPG